MSVNIENLTDKPLWLRLNSGAALSIMPSSRAQAVPDGEVIGNLKLEKLAQKRVIRVHKEGGEAPERTDPDTTEGRRARRTPAGTHRRDS